MAKHGMHKMPNGMMMSDAEMSSRMRGGSKKTAPKKGAKPKFGTPEFFASLKKGKKTSKKSSKRGRGK